MLAFQQGAQVAMHNKSDPQYLSFVNERNGTQVPNADKGKYASLLVVVEFELRGKCQLRKD